MTVTDLWFASKTINVITYEYVRPNLPDKVKRKRKNTTLAIYPEIRDILRDLKQPSDRSVNDVIKRLVGESQGVVKVDVIAIDNELPQLHTMIAQIGEDKDSVFLFDGQNLKPTTLIEINRLIKQPNLNMTITREEAELIKEIDDNRPVRVFSGSIPKPIAEWDQKVEAFLKRIEKFLENQPSGKPVQ